jgi:plasmid rolling circle replication initiator protein Rep
VNNIYDGEDLGKSLKAIAQGFNRLVKYKKPQKI